MGFPIYASKPRYLKAGASTSVKVFAIAGLLVALAASIAIPQWLMGVVFGAQLMVVWEAFRVFKIPVRPPSGKD
jgi:hypothetical protein